MNQTKTHQPTTGEVIQVQISFYQIAAWLRLLPGAAETEQAIRTIESRLDCEEQSARGREKERGY